jgi:hypothetical protein
VDLQARRAVHDVDASAVERARPLDVPPLVEACPQLDETDGMLPCLGSVDERATVREGFPVRYTVAFSAATFGSREVATKRSTLVS